MATPAFRTGAEASQEASKGGNFARTNYFGLEDGKSVHVRFLTDHDAWLVVDRHNMIPTKAKPADWEGQSWPEKMSAVCRKDEAFTGIHTDCYICDYVVDGKKVKKPSGRTYAVACLREEVVEGGQVVGVRDQTREVTIPAKDGQPERKVREKAIVVVNQGYKNFFSALKGFAGHYGTILDRDYYIKREGSTTDTDYTIIPMDPIVTESGKKLDLRDPEFAGMYPHDINLEEIVTEQASDVYYARFFDPRFTVNKENVVSKTGAAPEPKPENDADEGKLAQIASRIKGYQAGPDGPAAPVAPAAPAKPESTLGLVAAEARQAPPVGPMRNFS